MSVATMVRAARILAADSAAVADDGALLLRDGRFERVERGIGQLPAPGDVDVGDVTVLPGSIDAHVHLAFDATAMSSSRCSVSTTLPCTPPCTTTCSATWTWA